MMHVFKEFGNSILMMSDVEPIPRTDILYAHVVLQLEDDVEFRLLVRKCRIAPAIDCELIRFLKEDFPSITIERHLYPDAPYLEGEINEYVVFKDDTEAVHFKLKYC
jgi:hypothetical protein